MTAAAPNYRAVCQLTGQTRPEQPSKFFRALSEADNFCNEIADVKRLRDENAALRAQVADLEAELAWLTRTSFTDVPPAAVKERPAPPTSPRSGAGHTNHQ